MYVTHYVSVCLGKFVYNLIFNFHVGYKPRYQGLHQRTVDKNYFFASLLYFFGRRGSLMGLGVGKWLRFVLGEKVKEQENIYIFGSFHGKIIFLFFSAELFSIFFLSFFILFVYFLCQEK